MVHWKLVQWTFLREVPLGKTLMPHGTLSKNLREDFVRTFESSKNKHLFFVVIFLTAKFFKKI